VSPLNAAVPGDVAHLFEDKKAAIRVRWLHARDGLVDTERWRVRLQEYHPVGRFGASFYVRTRDRFSVDGTDREAKSTAIDEI
jgi:hypothetical protein